jgi:hypothetical protein
MLARSGSAQPETAACSACLETTALCQVPQFLLLLHCVPLKSNLHSLAGDIKLWQHHADCSAETTGNQRRRHSHMELAWPLREKRRERHSDSCPDGWLRAAKIAELEAVPVRVVKLTDAEAIEAQVVELSVVGKNFLC